MGIQSSRIGSALVWVRRKARYIEPRLPESKRFVLNIVVIVSMSTRGPIGCPLSSRFLSSQNVQSHENSYTNLSARGETPTISLALDTTSESRERVKV